jgi:hypothetical protein
MTMEERGDAILGRRRRPVMRREKERGERGGGGVARRREASPEEERRRRRTPGRGAGARQRRSWAGNRARFVTGGGRFGSQRRHRGRRHGRGIRRHRGPPGHGRSTRPGPLETARTPRVRWRVVRSAGCGTGVPALRVGRAPASPRDHLGELQ